MRLQQRPQRLAIEGRKGSTRQDKGQARERLAGKRTKAQGKNHAEGLCNFGVSCQFSHAAPAVSIAATGCCIDLQDDNDMLTNSVGEVIYVTLLAMYTVYCIKP